jgi:Peptidase A4 family
MKSYEKCVKFVSYGAFVALIGSLLISSPQSFAQDAESSPSAPLRLTVAPHTSSRLAMKTIPKALCMLHAAGDSDPSNSFKVFSDDEGTIRFNVNPSEQSDEVAAFAVDCTSDAESRTFELELRPDPTPSFDMPAPAAEIRTPKASDIIRPALTKAQALQLSDEEVVRREYPIRPNPEQAPDAFAKWLQIVSHPARRLDARAVPHPELRGSTQATTWNWSGFDMKNAPNEMPVSTYDIVEGDWNVPTVTAPVTSYSAFWVGLDGDDGTCPNYCPGNGHTSDLWQAGTGQQTKTIIVYQYPYNRIYCFSTYYAWTELVPTQYMQVLPNFSVSPGDEMYVDVWVGDAGQSASLSGAYGVAFVEDLTRGEYTYVYTPRGQVNVLGYQAEWIMERPFENNVLPNLSDYNYAYMYSPFAHQTNGSWISYSQATTTRLFALLTGSVYSPGISQQLFMTEDGTTASDLLSAGYYVSPSTIYYQWYNYR